VLYELYTVAVASSALIFACLVNVGPHGAILPVKEILFFYLLILHYFHQSALYYSLVASEALFCDAPFQKRLQATVIFASYDVR
jgi:hypothetical protein